MGKEGLITFETAKLAKEKGFKYKSNLTSKIYIDTGEIFHCLEVPLRNWDNPPEEYRCFTNMPWRSGFICEGFTAS